MPEKELKIRRLEGLSRREMEVVWYLCRGTSDSDTANILDLSIKALQARRTGVYKKLQINVPDPDKQNYLYSRYRTEVFELVPTEEALKAWRPRYPEDIDNQASKTEEQEKGTKPSQDTGPREPTGTVPPARPSRRIRVWIFLAAIAGIVAFVAYFAYRLGQNASPSVIVSPTFTPPGAITSPTLPPPTPIPSQAPVVQVAATPTPVPPAATLAPTNTALSIPLQAFSDDFGQGPSSQWNVLNGQWLTANGKYTTLADYNQYAWLWSVLDGSTWTNYRVKVDYKMNYPYAAAQGELAVAVRMSDQQTLAFTINTLMYGGWAFVGAENNDIQYLAGEVKDGIPTSGTLQLEAVADNFTARINGRVVQTLNLSGFDTGGVGLGINCHNDIGECPTFDNFTLEPVQ